MTDHNEDEVFRILLTGFREKGLLVSPQFLQLGTDVENLKSVSVNPDLVVSDREGNRRWIIDIKGSSRLPSLSISEINEMIDTWVRIREFNLKVPLIVVALSKLPAFAEDQLPNGLHVVEVSDSTPDELLQRVLETMKI